MKKVISYLLYELQLYFKSSKFIMPIIVTAIFLGTMYSIKPVGVVSSILISCNFIFCLMVWIGIRVVSTEEPVSEQIMQLRIQKYSHYALTKILFLSVIGLLLTCICVVYPVLSNIKNGNILFDRTLMVQDVANAFVLEFGCAFVGGALGSLFHPIILKDRKIAIVLTFLIALLSVIHPAMEAVAFVRWLGWILPPVSYVANIYGNLDNFNFINTVGLFAGLVLYAGILYFIKAFVCHKKKFT